MVTINRNMPAVLQSRREKMNLTYDEFIYGLMTEGWISELEALNWLRRDSLPAALQAEIDTLAPQAKRKAMVLLYTAASFNRLDQAIQRMAQAFNKSDEVMDTFFETYRTQ